MISYCFDRTDGTKLKKHTHNQTFILLNRVKGIDEVVEAVVYSLYLKYNYFYNDYRAHVKKFTGYNYKPLWFVNSVNKL